MTAGTIMLILLLVAIIGGTVLATYFVSTAGPLLTFILVALGVFLIGGALGKVGRLFNNDK